MPKDKSNSIRIFWIEQDKEKSVRIYPKNIPEKKWQNGTELYIFGLTEVCRYFNCLTPDELDIPVRWCYDLATIYRYKQRHVFFLGRKMENNYGISG